MRKRKTRIKDTGFIVTVALTVSIPVVVCTLFLVLRKADMFPAIGSMDSWLVFVCGISGASLATLALTFTTYYERKVKEKHERLRVRPFLFGSKREMVHEACYGKNVLECDNICVLWELKNRSDFIADQIRIVNEKVSLRNGSDRYAMTERELLKIYQISVKTDSLHEYLSLEPHGTKLCRTSIYIEEGISSIERPCKFIDVVDEITLQYTDISGIETYRSILSLLIHIGFLEDGRMRVSLHDVETRLMGE